MASTEIGAKYTLTGPRGDVVTFNDPTDANNVGMLTDVTGMDSPDVRESADDLVQMDGGIHGDFFYSRRPITLSGILLNPGSAANRNVWQDKLSAACDALRGDCTLSWTPSGGTQRFLKLRRQQPLRVTGTWQKEFQIGMVAADPRIYSNALNQDGALASGIAVPGGRSYSRAYPDVYGGGNILGQVLVTNAGNTDSYPIISIAGPGTNPSVLNYTLNKRITLLTTLSSTDVAIIDTLNRTVTISGHPSYSTVDFLNSAWWPLAPGVNDLRLSFSTYASPASFTVTWRNAWM